MAVNKPFKYYLKSLTLSGFYQRTIFQNPLGNNILRIHHHWLQRVLTDKRLDGTDNYDVILQD
jgi:hypothetical protein